ncbi:uncharacterized protein LOC143301059 [Babylonia areolata]|uniref:uncharacterized protein LOC143301059 n=1 Tax=Babylonia areolata TaxID=304850 RepID=UPI003FD2AA40
MLSLMVLEMVFGQPFVHIPVLYIVSAATQTDHRPSTPSLNTLGTADELHDAATTHIPSSMDVDSPSSPLPPAPSPSGSGVASSGPLRPSDSTGSSLQPIPGTGDGGAGSSLQLSALSKASEDPSGSVSFPVSDRSSWNTADTTSATSPSRSEAVPLSSNREMRGSDADFIESGMSSVFDGTVFVSADPEMQISTGSLSEATSQTLGTPGGSSLMFPETVGGEEYESTSDPLQPTTIQMSPSVHEFTYSPSSTGFARSTADLDVESTTDFSMIAPSPTTATPAVSFSDMTADSSSFPSQSDDSGQSTDLLSDSISSDNYLQSSIDENSLEADSVSGHFGVSSTVIRDFSSTMESETATASASTGLSSDLAEALPTAVPSQSVTSQFLFSSEALSTAVPVQSVTSHFLFSSEALPTAVPSQLVTSQFLFSSEAPPTAVPSQSVTSQFLFSSEALPTAVPSQSMTSKFPFSSEALPTAVPSQSVTSHFLFSSEAPSTAVPSSLPSSNLKSSSDYVHPSSMFSQTGMISSESLSTSLIPIESVQPASSGQSDTILISAHSSEMFKSTAIQTEDVLSTAIQTEDVSLSVMSSSSTPPLTSLLPTSTVFTGTVVQSISLAPSSSLADTSVMVSSTASGFFSSSVGNVSTMTDILPITTYFSSLRISTSTASVPESSSLLFTELAPSDSSVYFSSETMTFSLSVDLFTSTLRSETLFSSEMLDSIETFSVSSFGTYSASFIPVPSFSTDFTTVESSLSFVTLPSFSTDSLSMESLMSSGTPLVSSTSLLPVQSSQSAAPSTLPLQSFISTISGIPTSYSSVLPLESDSSVSSESHFSSGHTGSTILFEPSSSMVEIISPSFSGSVVTEIHQSSEMFSTEMRSSTSSMFMSSAAVSTAVPPFVSTVTLFTSTEVSSSLSTLQTSASSVLQPDLSSVTDTTTFSSSVLEPSSSVIVTSESMSLSSSPSSEVFDTSGVTSDVFGPSSVLGSLSTAIVPTSSVLGSLSTAIVPTSSVLGSLSTAIVPTSSVLGSLSTAIVPTSSVTDTTEMSSSTPVAMDTSSVIQTSGIVAVSSDVSTQQPTQQTSSLPADSVSEFFTYASPSLEASSFMDLSSTLTVSMFSSLSVSVSEILPSTSMEVMSTTPTSSAMFISTSSIPSSSSSLESVSDVPSSGSVVASSQLLPSSSDVISSLETSSSYLVTYSTVMSLITSSLATPSSLEMFSTSFVPSSVVDTSSEIVPSLSSSSEITSSSVSPQPTTTPPTTTGSTTVTEPASNETTTTAAVSTTTVAEDLLVVTVIRLRSGDDIQSQAFITAMEEGLARAYSLAFQRQQGTGGLSSTRRKRFAALFGGRPVHLWSERVAGVVQRRKRAVVNDVEVKITDVSTQAATPTNAELRHTVKRNGQPVQATQASEVLNGLLDQELALELDRVVITKATPAAGQTAEVSTGEDSKLWIIGAVLGPVVLLLVVWLLVCLLVRHRAWPHGQAAYPGFYKPCDPYETSPKLMSRESGEVAEDPEYAQAVPGQSNGLVKSSAHKMSYEVTPDHDTSATSTGRASSSFRASKRGRKLPRKKSLQASAEETEGEPSSEKVSEKSTPPKKKNGKKSSLRETEEMEMSPLDPGFYNSATLQASRQLYAQQTFEEEDDDFLDKVEEERRKNKQRQRMKKKQGGSVAAQPPPVDTMQAAYERAQREIDRVLGPRHNGHPDTTPAVAVSRHWGEIKVSKRRSKRGQANAGYREEEEEEEDVPAPALQPSESLDEVKSRVHALLDDAFSLISNSYTSIGSAVSERSRSFRRNRVAPASPSKQGPNEGPTAAETQPQLAVSPPRGNMPAVEEVQDMGLAPKPGEKLHTPVLVDRTYGDYDADGLITWSPYRAADESARIVLPESQLTSSKAPVQEKLQTTTFMESASATGPPPPPHHHNPIVIRTRQPPTTSTQSRTDHHHRHHHHHHHQMGSKQNGAGSSAEKGSLSSSSPPLATTATAADLDTYTPYPGLEAYEDMLADTATAAAATTTARFMAAPPSVSGESVEEREPPLPPPPPPESSQGGEGDEHPDPPPPAPHQPPTRNVGTRDERDFIASRLAAGTSPKELVDSIRQELQSLSGKLPQGDGSGSSRRQDKTAAKSDVANGGHRGGLGNGNPKPLKKPRKSSYLDSN